jgi:maleate cis-trans isomerase
MRKVSRDIPVSTASQAIVGALQSLGVKKVSVGSPYTEDINQRLKLFLQGHAIQVMDIRGMFDPHEPISDFDFQSSDFGAVEKFVRTLDRPDADGILISCTGMPIVSFVDRLERELRKPIVSSNMAIMWDALHLAGVNPDAKGFGRLLARR